MFGGRCRKYSTCVYSLCSSKAAMSESTDIKSIDSNTDKLQACCPVPFFLSVCLFARE